MSDCPGNRLPALDMEIAKEEEVAKLRLENERLSHENELLKRG